MEDDSELHTCELAAALSISEGDLFESAGLLSVVEVHQPEGVWWGSGEPLQVLVGLTNGGAVSAAEPRFEWAGHQLLLRALDLQPVGARDELERQLDDIAKRRRRTFRYCRKCRRMTPPEHRNTGADLCDSCAARSGVVF